MIFQKCVGKETSQHQHKLNWGWYKTWMLSGIQNTDTMGKSTRSAREIATLFRSHVAKQWLYHVTLIINVTILILSNFYHVFF